jgi:hypothetical protein
MRYCQGSTCQPALSKDPYPHCLQYSSSSLDKIRRLVLTIRQGNRNLLLLYTTPYLLRHQRNSSLQDMECRLDPSYQKGSSYLQQSSPHIGWAQRYRQCNMCLVGKHCLQG